VFDRFSIMHVNFFSGILALAAPPSGSQPGQTQNPFMAFLPMILLVVVFYFILIRPQQQRAKAQAKLLAGLKAGDKVVTAAGIVGTVITVKDKIVSLRSADSKFEVTKASVTEIIAGDANTTTVS
jgi:preprotein translocase subunit YajC